MSELGGELELTVDRSGEVMVLRLTGKGALDTGAYLTDRLDQLADEAPSRVVLDLSGLAYASSLVMGALVRFRGRLRQKNASLRLAAPQPMVRESLQVSNLGKFLAVFDTIDEAMRD